MTEKFDQSLKNLFRSVSQISNHGNRRISGEMHPAHQNMAKFMRLHSAMSSKDPNLIPQLFIHFMNQNRHNLLNPIVLPDGNIRAGWLDIKTDGQIKKKTRDLNLNNHKPRGLAIYVDESDPKLYRNNIPLSEIYTEINKIYNDDGQNSDLPFRFLSQMMYCFYHASCLSSEVGPSERDILYKNATDLEGFIHETESTSTSESTKGGFMEQISGMMDKFNIGGALQGLQKNLGGLMSSDMATNVGDALKEIQHNVSTTSNFAEGLKKSFESGTVKGMISELQNKVKDFIPSNLSTPEVETDSNIVASDQE